MGGELDGSPAGLRRAGTQVAGTSEALVNVSSALGSAASALSNPLFGPGIGSAATYFSDTLAAHCNDLSATAAGHGQGIQAAAGVYSDVDRQSANGFQQVDHEFTGHPAI